MSPADHKLIFDCPSPGDLSRAKWSCSCGKWETMTPDVGPYGRRTAKARIAQVHMAHGKHARMTVQRGNLRQGKRNDNR